MLLRRRPIYTTEAGVFRLGQLPLAQVELRYCSWPINTAKFSLAQD
jgi:hypothetical protein